MGSTEPRPTFGVKTSQSRIGYQEILELWREAEQVPAFEHAWLWDHFVPLRGDVRGAALEAWTLLAALAAQTERLRLGVIVTSNRIRPPAVLAKMAATVDVISGGRLDFGIGAGGERSSLRVVAEHADIWNCPSRTADEFRHKSRVLDEHCAAVGRDPAEIVRSVQLLIEMADPSAPAAARERLLELIDAGARHLVLAPIPPWPPNPAHRLADEIVEPVLAQLPAR